MKPNPRRVAAAAPEQAASQPAAMAIGAFAPPAEHTEFETFARSLAHELRSPIAAIAGFGRALEHELEQGTSERARHYLSRIRFAGRQLDDCVDALISLAQVTHMPAQVNDVDLSSIAVAVLSDLKSLDPGREIKADIQQGLRARGDPRLLRIALENLLGNAWKFTGRRKISEIRFCRRPVAQQGQAYVVRDNGEGFDPAYAGKLFAPFGRLHSHAEFPGTGLGLANVQRIVARHGGRIWAESTQARGASFYFTLAA